MHLGPSEIGAVLMKNSDYWKKELGLDPHPEGGWYKRVFESEIPWTQNRPAMTSIYYLLEDTDFSALHRLKQDEQWHFYHGSPITIHEIDPMRDTEANNAHFGKKRFLWFKVMGS